MEEQLTRVFIDTKEKVLSQIEMAIASYKPNIIGEYGHSDYFNEEFKSYSTAFLDEIKKSILIEPLPKGWEYEWGITHFKAELGVVHSEHIIENDPFAYEVDQKYVLITVGARMLTAEEFALRCNTNVRTITQWIRRGKLKTVYKEGNMWRISALTEIPTNRGYINSSYRWGKKLNDLPEDYEFLNKYNSVTIKKRMDDKDKYDVIFFDDEKDQEFFSNPKVYGSEERENLELLLLADPQIEYIPELSRSIMGEIYFSLNNRMIFG